MNLKKTGKVFTSKFVGTGPSSYEKRIYRAAVSQRLRNNAVRCWKEHGNDNLTSHAESETLFVSVGVC